MAYNLDLADQVEIHLKQICEYSAKKMFGGVGFMINGNMCCGIHKDYLVFRLHTEDAQSALNTKCFKPFDITGRPMKGWVMSVENTELETQELNDWIDKAYSFVLTLPPK